MRAPKNKSPNATVNIIIKFVKELAVPVKLSSDINLLKIRHTKIWELEETPKMNSKKKRLPDVNLCSIKISNKINAEEIAHKVKMI